MVRNSYFSNTYCCNGRCEYLALMLTWESEQVREFDPVPASVTEARHFAMGVLREHGFPSWPAELLVSEVVTNVVNHAHTPFSVSVAFLGTARVTVVDGSSVLPVLREMVDDAEEGRGLFLVQALAHRWGIEHHPSGKQVWFEVARESLDD